MLNSKERNKKTVRLTVVITARIPHYVNADTIYLANNLEDFHLASTGYGGDSIEEVDVLGFETEAVDGD